jgi:hypothetical protein
MGICGILGLKVKFILNNTFWARFLQDWLIEFIILDNLIFND